MSTQANIIAFDGAGTPVAHTFAPVENKVEKDGTQVAVWKEQISTLPDYAQQRVIAKKRKLPSGVTTVSVRVETPVMEAVGAQNAAGYTAAPKVAFFDAVEIRGYYHERSTSASRKLNAQIALNIGNNVSTAVTPASAGIAAELFQQLVFPN